MLKIISAALAALTLVAGPGHAQVAVGAAAGKISKRKDQGYDFTLLPIQGTYHGLAVAAFEFYSMPETDDSGVSLILSANKQDVKKVLSRVKYNKVTNDIGDEKQAQVVFEGKYAAVLCF